MKDVKSTSFIALLFLLLATAFGLVILAHKKAEIFNKRTAITQGKVIDYNPSNHNSGTVEFWVGNDRYEFQTSQVLHSSDLGRYVPVHYDPQQPANANSGDPFPSFSGFLVLIGMLVILMVSLLTAIFYAPRASAKK